MGKVRRSRQKFHAPPVARDGKTGKQSTAETDAMDVSKDSSDKVSLKVCLVL